MYTYADAARSLGLNQNKLRGWLQGYNRGETRRCPAGEFSVWRIDGTRGFNFYTMIEAFVLAKLREAGVTMRTINCARTDLAFRFKTRYPFALQGILTDGRKILYALPELEGALLADGKGQIEFRRLIEQFCQRLEFNDTTDLAERFWPDGRQSAVIVDPQHSFGRPSILGTNISAEVLAGYVEAGEPVDVVARLYNLEEHQVRDAVAFEHRHPA